MILAPGRVVAALALVGTAALSACGSAVTSTGSSAGPSLTIPAAPTPGTILTVKNVRALVNAAGTNLTSAHESITISTSAADITGEGDVAKVSDGLLMQMTLQLPSGEAEVREVGQGFYIKLNLRQLGGKWIKIDLNKNTTLSQLLGSLTTTSPSQIFDQYSGGFLGGTFIGHDSVGDHYLVNVGTAAARKNLPPKMASNSLIQKGMAALPKNLRLHLWVKDGYLQQLVTDMGPTGSVTIKLSNNGEAVNVVAPPTPEVTSIPGLG